MFFKRKKRDDDLEAQNEFEVVRATVEGTQPETVEEADRSLEGTAIAPVANEATIRLFPGFEREDFEVGFAANTAAPALVMRWKDGGSWFTVPPLFNRAVLTAMDEKETANDLTRLLRNYGYDVDLGAV
ncbi:MAG: hypothetical protein AAF788_02025 [Pseudomonadota bacterium]